MNKAKELHNSLRDIKRNTRNAKIIFNRSITRCPYCNSDNISALIKPDKEITTTVDGDSYTAPIGAILEPLYVCDDCYKPIEATKVFVESE